MTGRAPGPSWLPAFLAIALIWGASFLFIKVAVGELAPLHVAFGRCAIGALVLVAVVAARRERLPRDRTTWGHLAVAALLLNALPFVLFAYGEERASSVLAGIWNATTPLFALVAALATLPEERPTRERVLGLLVGFGGVVVVLGPWSAVEPGSLAGQAMFAGAAACYGLAFPYTRRHLAGRPESALVLAAAQVALGALLLAPALPLAGVPSLAVGADVWGSMLALGALGTGLAYVLNYGVIRQAGATTASTVTYLIPLVATVLGVAVLGEDVAWHHPAGAVVVLVGIAASQGRLRRRR